MKVAQISSIERKMVSGNLGCVTLTTDYKFNGHDNHFTVIQLDPALVMRKCISLLGHFYDESDRLHLLVTGNVKQGNFFIEKEQSIGTAFLQPLTKTRGKKSHG